VERLLIVSAGGALGTAARYLLTGWIASRTSVFPLGTLAVNVLGSFLIGVIMEVALNTNSISPAMRLGLTTGVLGGFTTYSTFNYETLQMMRSGSTLLASANLAVTLAACIIAGIGGLAAGRVLSGA
jgi:CrcB protein